MILDTSKEDGAPLQRTYVAFVLDRSGSMTSILDQTIVGFNKQIDSLKREATKETFVSLVTFGSDVTPIYFNKPVQRLQYLSKHNYNPNGWTALYDAVGYTVNRLANEAEDVPNSAFWVIIISDGQENYSVDYKQSIGEVIRRKQQTGRWTFTYIGSNQDLAQVQRALSIPFGNMATWDSSPIGASNLYSNTASVVSNYLNVRKTGVTSQVDTVTSVGSSDLSATPKTDDKP